MPEAAPGPGKLRSLTTYLGTGRRRAADWPVCKEHGCWFRVDPVAAAEFDGRHVSCSLPMGEREALVEAHEALVRAVHDPPHVR